MVTMLHEINMEPDQLGGLNCRCVCFKCFPFPRLPFSGYMLFFLGVIIKREPEKDDKQKSFTQRIEYTLPPIISHVEIFTQSVLLEVMVYTYRK